MRYSLINKIIIISFVLAVSGCASIISNIPAPPDSMSKLQLKDPYDDDIPKKLINQLKWASVMSDWAIPYIFLNAGAHFGKIGDEKRALHYFDRAIAELQKRKDTHGEGTAISQKILYLNKFDNYEESHEILKEVEKKWSEAPLNSFVYFNYGHFYLINGDYKKALEQYRQSLASNNNYSENFNLLMLRRDTELEYGIALMLSNYFTVVFKKYNLQDFDEDSYKTICKNISESIEHLNQAKALNGELKRTKIDRFTPDIVYQVVEVKANNFLGLANGIKGQSAQAIKYLDNSEKLARKVGFKIGEINSILSRSQVYLMDRNIAAAEESAMQLSNIADKYQISFYSIWAKFILSLCYQVSGDDTKAINLLKDVVILVEKQRIEIAREINNYTHTYKTEIFYEALIEALDKKGDNKGAFEIAERAKSKMLVDLLSGKKIGKSNIEDELIDQGMHYINEISNGVRNILSLKEDDDLNINKALAKIKEAENAHNDIILKIKNQNEELYSLVSVESFDAENARKLLDQNTTIFSYYVANELLYIWALNKDRLHLEKVKIKKEEIAKLVFLLNASIAAKDHQKTASLSEKVYSIILKPIIPFVIGDNICIIPHGPLYYLPFAAMSYKGQYLVDAFTMYYLSNAGVLKYMLKKQPADGLNMLAFISRDTKEKKLDLPYFVTEMESVRNIYPQVNIILKGEATKAKVKSIADNYDVIHFATSCFFIEDIPIKSGLSLTPGVKENGRFTIAEIFKLKFKGRAIVLSASKVDPAFSSNGIEIIGLNRAFQYAGSPCVISTLWNIEEKSKATFMDLFYVNIGKNESIANSLRITQNEMIRQGYAPFDWAAFVINGRYI